MKSPFFWKQRPVALTPHYQPRTFLDSTEVSVYQALSNVFDANITILAKVCLAGLVTAPQERQYLAHWRRVQRRTLDFVICSISTLKPILAVKVESESDSNKRRTRAPDILEEVLENIGLPLLRLTAQEQYEAKDLTKKINLVLKQKRSTRSVLDLPSPEPKMTANSPHQPQDDRDRQISCSHARTNPLTDNFRKADARSTEIEG